MPPEGFEDPLRVLHVAAGNIFGGVEAGLLAFARNPIPGLAHEVALFFDEGRLAEELRSSGVPVHVLEPARLRYPWTVRRARQNLRRVLGSGGYDAVVVRSPWSYVISAPTIRETRTLLVHSVHGFLDPLHLLDRWASWSPPDLVIANSHATQSSARALFPRMPMTVIHPPVMAPPDPSTSRSVVRATLAAPEDALVVLMASRLERWKGHELLIRSMSRLDRRFVAWIVGGPQRAEEHSYFKELKAHESASVIFLGQRRDIFDLMRASDIHCQPNTSPEPFGIAFVEALHAQLPIVTTRMGGALEIVDDSCGVLVSPEPDSVAAALERLGSDPAERRRLGNNGPARARTLCDPHRQAEALRAALIERGCQP